MRCPKVTLSFEQYKILLDRKRRANGRNVTLPDGKTLFLGSSGTGAPK